MSKVTIYDNKDIIQNKIIELNSSDINIVSGYVLSQCLLAQYEMMQEHLNKNALMKRNFRLDLKDKELVNAYYQHAYMHNHIAFEDEIFEIYDALSLKYDFKYDNNKPNLSRLLVLEEYIDMFHFLLQYICIIEEHFIINLECDFYNKELGRSYTINDLHHSIVATKIDIDNNIKYYTSDRKKDIDELLKNKGYHISTEILYNLSKIPPKCNSSVIEDILFLNRLNRKFIRNCNFKDWKNYPIDYYDTLKLLNLVIISREMFTEFIFQFSKYVNYLNELDINYRFNKDNLEDVFKSIYGIYMAKRTENIRRQQNDPRYTGETIGEIRGIDVN